MEAGTIEHLAGESVAAAQTAEPPHALAEPDHSPPVPACEISHSLVLPEFDEAVRRAAAACETPIALVTVVTDDRHWIVSSVGLDVRDMPPRLAFCAQAILDGELLIVPDARADARFAASPLVTGKLGLRFYAGVPLFSGDGEPLGVFCVLDNTRPRALTSEQLEELGGIAREVGVGLELRRVSSQLRAAEQALAGQQAMHDAIVAAALDCIITIDAEGRVLEFNPAAERTFGYTRAEVVGRTMSELIIPSHLRGRHEHGVGRLLAGGEPRILNRRVELAAMRRDGSEFPIELTVTQLAAEPPLFSGHIRDISDRKRAEADQLRLAAIMHSTHDAVIGLDRDRRIRHWNAGAERLYGYTRSEIIGSGMETIVPSERHEELFSMLGRVLAGERVERLETQRVTKAGACLDVSITLSPIVDGNGELLGVSAIARDISDRKRLEAKLRHDAEHDPLTGLVNRRVFETRLEALTTGDQQSASGAVIFIDLDHFKLVNDSLGHRAGDELIRRVADTLRSSVRETDTVARLGGDEFAVLLPDCPSAQATQVAEELVARIAADLGTGNAGASAGIAAIIAGATAEDVMAAADMALYDAKTTGRRRAVLYDGQDSLTLRTVADVKSSIAAGRLILHGQPIVELAGGRVVQHELLVRMLDRGGQVLAPNRFIPIAERFGLIEQIDRWVLARAAELARAGRSVAVNISAHTLNDPATIELLQNELHTGLPAGKISFEITETAALSDIDTAREFAERLSRMGCGFALDDFGTGYGSLMHLKRLPITALKIDMEFIQNLSRDTADRHIVQALVGIAHGLGLTTVAEGVENLETLELLRELGIDQAQGFYIGRPGPIE
jgi:diguanylate cyclase (GGDEF)-like protein/PAS domain S-box-containing protein